MAHGLNAVFTRNRRGNKRMREGIEEEREKEGGRRIRRKRKK